MAVVKNNAELLQIKPFVSLSSVRDVLYGLDSCYWLYLCVIFMYFYYEVIRTLCHERNV